MDLQNITGLASSKEVCKHSKYSNKLQWGNTKGLRGLDIRKQSEVEQTSGEFGYLYSDTNF